MMLYESPDLGQVAILRDKETNELQIKYSNWAFGKTKPRLAMNMKGALYCRKYGLDPITVSMSEFSDTNEKYRTFRNMDIPPYSDEPTMPCKAVETEKGVVLFNDDESGNFRLREYLQYLADNFYEPDFGINTLRIYDLDIPEEKIPLAMNYCFNYDRIE